MPDGLVHKVLKSMEKDNWQFLPLLDEYYCKSDMKKICYNIGIYVFKTRKIFQDSKPSYFKNF